LRERSDMYKERKEGRREGGREGGRMSDERVRKGKKGAAAWTGAAAAAQREREREREVWMDSLT